MLGPLDLDWICHLDFLQHEMENILAYNNSSACRHCLSGKQRNRLNVSGGCAVSELKN